MSRITLVGGTTDRFVLANGVEGRLEVAKDPTEKQAEKGTPIPVVFVPDPHPVTFEDRPGHEITPANPAYVPPEA